MGYISQHRLDGTVIEKRWAEGFSSPKGVAVANGIVYVADPKAVVALDVKSGYEVARYTDEESGLFNDIAPAEDGTLYVTDTANAGFYRLDPGASADKALTPVRDERFEFANGITVAGDTAYVCTTGIFPSENGPGTLGRLFSVELGSMEVKEVEGVRGRWDGVVAIGDTVVVNDFMTGEVHAVDLGTREFRKLADPPFTSEMPPLGIADMNAIGSMLLLPSMFTNEIYSFTPALK